MPTRRSFLLAAAGAPLALAARRPTLAAQDVPERDYWPTRSWRTADPADVGLDAALLDEAERRAEIELPDLSALLVVRNGYLVRERYFGGHDPERPINVRSVTKSVVGAGIGAALADGTLRDLDQPLGDLLPDRIPAGADPRTAGIPIRHLLTMTAGWAWDIYADWGTLTAADDWAALTLSLPVVYEPGTYYAYNTGGSHLLSVILQAATGAPAINYVDRALFEPMGIDKPEWLRSPQRETSGGSGLELPARDMAKFGLLALSGGRWDDRQLVPADYLGASLSYQSAGDSTGLAAYGYQWWVTQASGYDAAFALGYGGQFVYVVPALDLCVVAGVARRVAPEELRSSRPIIEGLIVPAARPT